MLIGKGSVDKLYLRAYYFDLLFVRKDNGIIIKLLENGCM